MRKSLTLLLLVGILKTGSAQLAVPYAPPAYLKAGTYTDSATAYSFSNNQAALARTRGLGAAAYTSRLFMMKELTHFYGALSFPTHSGAFGLVINHFGNTEYNNVQLGLAYGRKLTEAVDVGVQLNYHRLHVNGYAGGSTVSVEGGTIIHFTDALHGGIHISYPAMALQTKDATEKLPGRYSMGLGYTLSKQALLEVEVEKEIGAKMSVHPSISFRIGEKAIARAGISMATATYFFSAGFLLRYLQLDAVANYHSRLGFTPGLMLIYQSPKK